MTSGFEASLVNKMSSRTTRAVTQRNLVLKNKTKQNNNNKNKNKNKTTTTTKTEFLKFLGK